MFSLFCLSLSIYVFDWTQHTIEIQTVLEVMLQLVLIRSEWLLSIDLFYGTVNVDFSTWCEMTKKFVEEFLMICA